MADEKTGEKKPLDPRRVTCVVKNKAGTVVGRVRATAPGASGYIGQLAAVYGEVSVDYVEDAPGDTTGDDLAQAANLLGGLFGGRR